MLILYYTERKTSDNITFTIISPDEGLNYLNPAYNNGITGVVFFIFMMLGLYFFITQTREARVSHDNVNKRFESDLTMISMLLFGSATIVTIYFLKNIYIGKVFKILVGVVLSLTSAGGCYKLFGALSGRYFNKQNTYGFWTRVAIISTMTAVCVAIIATDLIFIAPTHTPFNTALISFHKEDPSTIYPQLVNGTESMITGVKFIIMVIFPYIATLLNLLTLYMCYKFIHLIPLVKSLHISYVNVAIYIMSASFVMGSIFIEPAELRLITERPVKEDEEFYKEGMKLFSYEIIPSKTTAGPLLFTNLFFCIILLGSILHYYYSGTTSSTLKRLLTFNNDSYNSTDITRFSSKIFKTSLLGELSSHVGSVNDKTAMDLLKFTPGDSITDKNLETTVNKKINEIGDIKFGGSTDPPEIKPVASVSTRHETLINPAGSYAHNQGNPKMIDKDSETLGKQHPNADYSANKRQFGRGPNTSNNNRPSGGAPAGGRRPPPPQGRGGRG